MTNTNKAGGRKPTIGQEAIAHLVACYQAGRTFHGRAEISDCLVRECGLKAKQVYMRCVDWDNEARKRINAAADGPVVTFPTPQFKHRRNANAPSRERQMSGGTLLSHIATRANTAHTFFAKSAAQIDAEARELALAELTKGLVSIANGASILAGEARKDTTTETDDSPRLRVLSRAAD